MRLVVLWLLLCVFPMVSWADWPMAGANPQRTGWVSDTTPLVIDALWAKPLVPYVPQEVQPIAADSKIFVSTAKGLYAFHADTGDQLWVYPTELPLGHSPTYASGILYVGGFDRRIHAVNATTGAGVWISDSADGPFENNPVVAGTRVFAGNKDGYFYAFSLSTGALSWRYKTEAPIRHSPAYNAGVLYFGSMDNRAYALTEAGALVWQSAVLPGMGWVNGWPVIYQDKVIFTRATLERGQINDHRDAVFGGAAGPTGVVPGVTGTEPGDWVAGTPTMNVATNPIDTVSIPDYLEQHPTRRNMFVLNQSNGAEVAYDLDSDSVTDGPPFLYTWEDAGNMHPPMISGFDGAFYSRAPNMANGNFPSSTVVGWKVGTPHVAFVVSKMSGQSFAWPADEPTGISGGGSKLYWNLCCDRFLGAADLSIANTTWPSSSGTRQQRYNDLDTQACIQSGYPAGYDVEKQKFLWSDVCAFFWSHGTQVGPTIYNNRLYVLRSNALVAFDATGAGDAAPTLASAATVAASSVTAPVSSTTLQARLVTELQKMLDAEGLRSGLGKFGNLEIHTSTIYDDNMMDYWHNPADTILVLVRALPFLSGAFLTSVRAYLQSEFARLPPYTYVHSGFTTGAARDNFIMPPFQTQIFTKTHASQTTTSFTGWSFPPHNVYAVWKYAQAGLGDPATLFAAVAGTIGTTPTDAYLAGQPHVHNAYIAGLQGYVNLCALASGSCASQTTELNRLKALRLTNWTRTPVPTVGNAIAMDYYATMIHSWNFMYMVPELAAHLLSNIGATVLADLAHSTAIAPLWMYAMNEETQGENGVMPYQQTHALFQAHAWFLQNTQAELVKVLDSPQYPRGDLYYIDNLLATLEAEADETPVPPTIVNVTDNRATYPGSTIPRWGLLEITFDVTTVATDLYSPYVADAPPGMPDALGITVDVLFSPDNFVTTWRQPAFLYQVFDDQLKGGNAWYYPTSTLQWKARFAPPTVGAWQYKISAQDSAGTTESPAIAFTVTASSRRGFLKVSPLDKRYFAFDDGTYFPALGYNLNYRNVDWVNPASNSPTFQTMQTNGIQLTRIWLTQWSIWGSAWGIWLSHNPAHQQGEPRMGLGYPNFTAETIRYPGLTAPTAVGNRDVYLWLRYDTNTANSMGRFTPCRVFGWEAAKIPLKQATTYRIRARYNEQLLEGPRVGGQPFGFAIKHGGFMWHNTDETQRCYYPGTGTVLAATYPPPASQWSNFVDPDNAGWSILEGTFSSGSLDFLDHLYLTIENTQDSNADLVSGHVFVDEVSIQEVLGGGNYGPNVIYKPTMNHHQYINQRNAYAFDVVMAQADTYGVYFKPVITEKNDFVLRIFNFDGTMSTDDNGDLFFGNGTEGSGATTKIRFLQRAWWRYAQARWGYSQAIHGWELLNEGVSADMHYILTDQFAKFMKCGVFGIAPGSDCPQTHPNHHIVTTSMASGFPAAFWANSSGNYPDVDYADYHDYLDAVSETGYNDAALFTLTASLAIGAYRPGGALKPVIRGETGWRDATSGTANTLFNANASNGLWLHNLLWGSLNPHGLLEHYWVGAPTQDHIYESGSHDHRPLFKNLWNFLAGMPLHNGTYVDAAATVGNAALRAWGQKDLTAQRAHLWVQNSAHTWKNIVDAVTITPITTTVTIPGMAVSTPFQVEWWDTSTGVPSSTQTVTSASNGDLVLNVTGLTGDLAVRVGDFRTPRAPTNFRLVSQ